MNLSDAFILLFAGFCSGFGIEFAKWFFEKLRHIEKKVKPSAS